LVCSIVNIAKFPEKLEDYADNSKINYLPIANTILDHDNPELDKELYKRLRSTIKLSRVALNKSPVEAVE
jgi:hypothetical protein